MHQELKTYIQSLEDEVSKIPDERKEELQEISDYIRSEDPAQLVFICTHNSRRSHFCQIWTAVIAQYLDIKKVRSFSGGTEATEFNARAVAALERTGFRIERTEEDNNPKYKVYFDEELPPQICFSKKFDDPYNPRGDFAAVMTCSDADQDCPHVPGASFRISIPYKDPKEADGTSEEAQVYDERCRQIATEMFYLMSLVVNI